jgi:hypothetical protein
MALALGDPDMVRDIVVVDNAPWDAALGSNFPKYIQGMRKIDDADVSRHADADRILEEYENVRILLANPESCTYTACAVFAD